MTGDVILTLFFFSDKQNSDQQPKRGKKSLYHADVAKFSSTLGVICFIVCGLLLLLFAPDACPVSSTLEEVTKIGQIGHFL